MAARGCCSCSVRCCQQLWQWWLLCRVTVHSMRRSSCFALTTPSTELSCVGLSLISSCRAREALFVSFFVVRPSAALPAVPCLKVHVERAGAHHEGVWG